ncbi:MAG: hypothetical protein RLZZ15_2162 [Verrucomicrobiota bacterium]
MPLPRPLFALAAFFSAALFVTPPARAADHAFDAWADAFAAEWMRANPAAATTQQYFSGAEQDALDRLLTPIGPAARAARVALAQRGLAELGKFDRTQLDGAQRISAAMVQWQLDDVVTGEPFDDFGFVFNQFRGLQVGLVNFLSQTHPVRHRRDIENYLARLELVAAQLDTGLALATQRAARGLVPPKFILTATIDQIGRFLAPAPRQNVLVASLDERAALLPEKILPAADRAAFVASAEKIVAAQILPAFHRVRALLESQLSRATDAAGLSSLPGGAAAYANALRRNTTTALAPAEIHDLGLREVARIEAQMDALLRDAGLATGSVKERYEQLNARAQPAATPDPRPALIARYTEILHDAEKRAALVFDLRPRAPCEVRREPPFTEKNAAAHYTAPAPDGTRPGVFWAPLPGPTFNIVQMRTLVYHEAIPGHHFQVALQGEMESLPRFRRDRVFGFLPAHAEGWALYAERLAAENHWYDGDPLGAIGQLNSELFRARRLVVDTSLHAKNWTRQQAIDYGIPVSEVERYVVMPGQACAYKIGELRILELRAKAQRALGEKFSLKEFHNVVLRTGGVPLEILAVAIDDWIREKA